MAQVRYLVNDVEMSIRFYQTHLGFQLEQQFGPAMAILSSDDLKLWLAGPASSAAKPMPDGQSPSAGGWARIVVTCADLDSKVSELTAAGITFRNQVLAGPGGRQVLIDDPSGNCIELFEPAERPD